MNNPSTNDSAPEDDMRSVEAALQRAALKARLLAIQTNTPLVVVRQGQLVIEQVSDSAGKSTNTPAR